MYWGRVGQEARLVCTCTVGGSWAKFDNALCDDPRLSLHVYLFHIHLGI